MKPSIEILTRSPINLEALVRNFAPQPLIEPRNARDWVEAGSDVIQSTQNPNKHGHLSKKCGFWKYKTEIRSCRHFV